MTGNFTLPPHTPEFKVLCTEESGITADLHSPATVALRALPVVDVHAQKFPALIRDQTAAGSEGARRQCAEGEDAIGWPNACAACALTMHRPCAFQQGCCGPVMSGCLHPPTAHSMQLHNAVSTTMLLLLLMRDAACDAGGLCRRLQAGCPPCLLPGACTRLLHTLPGATVFLSQCSWGLLCCSGTCPFMSSPR